MADLHVAEEGEIEDGELADDGVLLGNESGEASGSENIELSRPGDLRLSPESSSPVQATSGIQKSRPQPAWDAREAGKSSRDRENERISMKNRDRNPPKAGRDSAKESETGKEQEREKEELLGSLKELTRDVSVSAALRCLDMVCRDLKTAIRKLDKLYYRVRGKRGADVESFPECFQYSKRIHEGLKNVHILSNTGIGKTQNMEQAKDLMRTALDYRHDILSSNQKREFENWLSTSQIFRPVLEERQKSLSDTAEKDDAVLTKLHTVASCGALTKTTPSSLPPHVNDDDSEHPVNGNLNTPYNNRSELFERQAVPESVSLTTTQQKCSPSHELISSSVPTVTKIASPSKRSWSESSGNGLIEDSSMKKPKKENTHSVTLNPVHSPPPESPVSSDAFDELLDMPVAATQSARAPSSLPFSHSNAQDNRAYSPFSGLDLSNYPFSSLPHMTDDMAALLKTGRLCLVLDLDHTLLNSAKYSEIDLTVESILKTRHAVELETLPEGQRQLFKMDKLGMWTKLRPGIHTFIARAAERFELWVHTNGNRFYAESMVDLIDPGRQYLGRRVIAQGAAVQDEAAAAQTKRLMAGLEGREPVAVIVDDSSAVWPHDRRNLFMVEQYLYFPSSRRRFGMDGRSLLEVNRDECPELGMLGTAMSMLERIHSAVFRALLTTGRGDASALPAATPSDRHLPVWDVRRVMDSERIRVLAGVHIVFSRVIPLEADPTDHPLWQVAEQFGAVCSANISEATTHIVAAGGGTEKVQWAVRTGRHVVTPSWLECSCIMWRRADEAMFAVPLV